jgi:hypothetical protein
MRPKRATKRATSLRLTAQKIGARYLIYIDGYPAGVTELCFQVLNILTNKRIDSPDGWVSRDHLLAKTKHPQTLSVYIGRWESNLSDQDSRLKGIRLFEPDGVGRWRLVVPADSIKFETKPGCVSVAGKVS